MARRTYLFDPPERFIAGTVGQPGSRTFFLQAREGARIVSVSLEKVQVAALAERLGRLLFELDQRGIVTLAEEPRTGDEAPLDEPLTEAFRARTLTLGWDRGRERILIEARPEGEDDEEAEEPTSETDLEHLLADDDDPNAPDLLRVLLTAQAARGFAERSLRVLRAGRPPCPLCGNPLDPQGHICPRRNGQYVH